MTKLLTLEAWAAAHYDTPPHINTLRKWARDGYIPAKRQGKTYYVPADAAYSDYRKPSLVSRINGR